jgi:ribosomal RNA-processing protein 9
MSSFFTNPASQKKRKRSEPAGTSTFKRRNLPNGSSNQAPSSRKPQRDDEDDESISGSESGSEIPSANEAEDSPDLSSEDEHETAAERRLKLAERYLENIRNELAETGIEEDPNAFDAAEIDRETISRRLREDVAESKGKVYKLIASSFDFEAAAKKSMGFRADQLGLTALAVSGRFIYVASKDRTISKWETSSEPLKLLNGSKEAEMETPPPTNIATRRKPKLLKKFTCRLPKPSKKGQTEAKKDQLPPPGHIGQILCLAVSPNGKFLATGGQDKRLVIWDAKKLRPIKAFINQHRDSVLGVSFRRHNVEKGPQTLYTGSADRTIKVWNVEGEIGRDSLSITYIETLFGHEDSIVDIVGLAGEKCVSVGARDRSARMWKIVEENQLVFRGGGTGKRGRGDMDDGGQTAYSEGSIDRVAMIDEETFVTGSDNGGISLWSVLRKKPIFTISLAHGTDPPPTIEETFGPSEEGEHERQGSSKPRWITALTTIPYSDMILSGSWDGTIRVWKVSEDKRRLESAGDIGRPNTLTQFGEDEVLHVNGNGVVNGHHHEEEYRTKPIKGIINDLQVFERGDRGKEGISVVCAVSRSHRLGRYGPVKQARDEIIMFNVEKSTDG